MLICVKLKKKMDGMWNFLWEEYGKTKAVSLARQKKKEIELKPHQSTEEHISTPSDNAPRGYSVSSAGGRTRTEE